MSAGAIRVGFWANMMHVGRRGGGCNWKLPIQHEEGLAVAHAAVGSSEHLSPRVLYRMGTLDRGSSLGQFSSGPGTRRLGTQRFGSISEFVRTLQIPAGVLQGPHTTSCLDSGAWCLVLPLRKWSTQHTTFWGWESTAHTCSSCCPPLYIDTGIRAQRGTVTCLRHRSKPDKDAGS